MISLNDQLLVKNCSMAELPDKLNAQIQRICAEGDALIDQQRYEDAVARFSSAWELLPSPQTDWVAATWILAAIADAHFLRGDFASMRKPLMMAMRCDGATANPFLRLRLGQCLFELGNWMKPPTGWQVHFSRRERRYSPRMTPSTSHSSSRNYCRLREVGRRDGSVMRSRIPLFSPVHVNGALGLVFRSSNLR